MQSSSHPDLLVEHLNLCKTKSNIFSNQHCFDNDYKTINHDKQIDIFSIPNEENPNHPVIKNIFNFTDNNNNFFGGTNSSCYLISEIMDNIYQHSNFLYAYVIMRSFDDVRDIIFLDRGNTIKDNFTQYGIKFQCDSDAIFYAINGLSSKHGLDRGHGLSSSIRIVKEGLDGQIFIVSGSGAMYLSKNFDIKYNLPIIYEVPGTLLIIRSSNSSKAVDIYQYL